MTEYLFWFLAHRKIEIRITVWRGHPSTEQQLGGSTDRHGDCSLAKMTPKRRAKGLFRGISHKYRPP